MTSALENIKTIAIDKWLTLATAPSSTKLQPGQTPFAFNTWVDEKPGSVITANGFRKVGTLPSGKPGTFCINYFKTSAGTQTFVVSDNATVWTTIDFQSFTSIITGLSSLFQLRGAVIRDKLWLTNGNDPVRTFDGSTVTILDGNGGTPNVPKGRFIAYHDERVWLFHQPSARSLCSFSALTDSGGNIIAPDNVNAWPNTNSLQISEGDADFGTGLLLYRGYLHFFKQYSIWRLVGYDEYTYTRVKSRASTGTRFNESLQILDSLVHLIGIDGIYVFDGEETERISDIIDPDTAEQSSFGFNQLQQPNTNNLFWEVSTTADFNAGTVPQNISINNEAILQAKDDTQADFQAGDTSNNIDATSNPGSIQLTQVASGGSSVNAALGKSAILASSNNVPQLGNPSQLTDGVLSGQQIGFQNRSDNTIMVWSVDLGAAFVIGSATVNSLAITQSIPVIFSATVEYSTDNVNWNKAGTLPSLTVDGIARDYSVNFAVQSARYWRINIQANIGTFVLSEIQFFKAGYQASGQFISRAIDFGDIPNSLGNFFSDFALNGQSIVFVTQSSVDGTTWDGAIAVTSGSAIGSVPRRFFRWIATLTSNGLDTPVISDVWVGSLYESAIHDTGGNIFVWGAFEADYDLNGQTVSFYYRGSNAPGSVTAAAWNLIAPGGAMNMSINNRYIQFKFEISGLTSGNNPPVVRSVTLNWVAGTGLQQPVLQNVASFVWRNRYWLSAAGAGSTINNTILIRGKKTFGSPWQLKDWNILSFTRYLDNFYGTSSVDGSIYQLDTGFSKDGGPINSIFETGDFTFGGFQAQVREIVIETQRIGPWNLAVSWSTDMGQTWVTKFVDLTLASGASFSYWKKVNNQNLTTDKLRVRFFTNTVDQPWQVHNCLIYYTLSSQRGSVGTN